MLNLHQVPLLELRSCILESICANAYSLETPLSCFLCAGRDIDRNIDNIIFNLELPGTEVYPFQAVGELVG